MRPADCACVRGRGIGGSIQCRPCRQRALAAATGTAKTAKPVECEASQSGGEAVTPNLGQGTEDRELVERLIYAAWNEGPQSVLTKLKAEVLARMTRPNVGEG
jgi:hypothetical protein